MLYEVITPLFVRSVDSKFNLANFMRVHLFTALGALKIGLDILLKQEGVQVDSILGHGGLFKTKEVGQKIMAAAMNAPVSVMETAGEGGAWGIAVLASYMMNKEEKETLDAYLTNKVFAGQNAVRITSYNVCYTKLLRLSFTNTALILVDPSSIPSAVLPFSMASLFNIISSS